MNYAKRELSREALERKAPAIFTKEQRPEASNQYLFVPTYEILDSLEKEGFVPVDAFQAGTVKEENQAYATHLIEFVHRDNLGKNALAEEFPTIKIRNNHLATRSLKGDTGIYRKVCSNGLVMRVSEGNSFRVVHHKNFSDEVVSQVINVFKNFYNVREKIETFKTIELDKSQKTDLSRLVAVEHFGQEIITLNDQKGNSLEKRILRPKRRADNKNDLWTILNVIQENIIRGRVSYYKEKDDQIITTKSRAINSIDNNTKVNQMIMEVIEGYCNDAVAGFKKEEEKIIVAA